MSRFPNCTGLVAAIILAVSPVARSADFRSEVDGFVDELWEVFPDRALVAGRYERAGTLPVPDAATLVARHRFITARKAVFDRYDPATLGPRERADQAVLGNFFDTWLWTATRLRPLTWRADLYDVTPGFSLILSRSFAPMEDRLLLAGSRMGSVAAYYAAARANLSNPTLEHTAAALVQSQVAVQLFVAVLPDRVRRSLLPPAQQTRLIELSRLSAIAVLHHQAWLLALRERLEAGGAKSSRLGGTLFDEKFALESGAEQDPLAVYNLAVRTRDEIHARMTPLAERIWPRYFPAEAWPAQTPLVGVRRVLDVLGENQVAGSFMQTMRGQVAELRRFVETRDLVELDPTRPLVVRGAGTGRVMAASVEAPGPYDSGDVTFYNITEPAADLAREYNLRTLQLLNMHEAMPGHYVQLMHANQAGTVASVFRNPALTEGWGLYAERMMLEQGYGDHEPELWLLYYKWFLRSVTNAILDRDVHVNGVDREAALRMLQETAFQERTEAEGKWQRAMLTQVQLSTYFTGFSEIYGLREDLRAASPAFDLKQFHARFLGFGSIPVRIIRERMLGEALRAAQP